METVYDKAQKLNSKNFKLLIGVKKETFQLMLEHLNSAYQIQHRKGGRPRSLPMEDQLIMTLRYLRYYPTQRLLAFVDLGYLGILKFHENTFIPAKNSKNRRLSEDDKQLNKEMSAIRIEIEHFNAKFKTFQIMSVPYRNRRKRFELRAELICAIINYEVN
ncbi:transposase (IS4 family) [Streptococcus pneumoniae]|nr:transposase (IS4 family) [Streptococcus pneumoniae]